ncbi:MAG TPA: dihydrolipoyl dehydrogenase [Clostridia bacterium]|nr:dihydrolipoyl dehydrogenase [Clostridia bacterium]
MIYDLIVIGGGPAGYLGAQRAAGEGLNTLLIEGRKIGGVCLNEGCIPSKTLLNSAKIYDSARSSDKYGVTSKEVNYDHPKVIKRKDKVVRILVAGINSQLKAAKVTVVKGYGCINGKNDAGYVVKVEDEAYIGKRLLIATGSMPIIPPIPGVQEGLDEGRALTNREILDLKEIPESLIIVGGGVIGLEMASYYNSVGSKVTVIEMLDHIAGETDRDISNILLKNYRAKGIDFKLGGKMTSLEDHELTYEINGEEHKIKADKVLMSIGRKPVTEGLGLETIGVEVDRGRIKTDETGLTNIPNVYAAGDVNGISLLAHTAYREAEVCVNNMVGNKDKMSYNAIPSVIYTNPEVASVGETEGTAKAKGIEVDTVQVSMRYSGRYVAENEGGDGICKIIVGKKHGRLLGVHMIGNPASEIIYGAALMIESQMGVKDIKKMVFPHPTVAEIIREGIFQL